MKTPSKHHPISPSRARRVELCPASIRLEREAELAGLAISGYEAVAKEGSDLHEEIADPDSFDGRLSSFLNANLVAQCNDFKLTVAPHDGLVREASEHPLVLSWEGEALTHGTADYVAWYPDKTVLIDFKTGHEEPDIDTVALQLELYAAALHNGNPVIAYVYGPRTAFTRSWIFDDPEATVERFETIKRASEAPGAIPWPGYSQCRYCSAKSVCPGFRGELPASRLEQVPVATADIAKALEIAAIAEPWAKAVKAAAREAMRNGQDIPGWRILTRKRRTVTNWPDALSMIALHAPEEEVEKAVRGSLEVLRDAYVAANTVDGISPAKARKEFEALIAPFCTETETAYLQRIEDNGTKDTNANSATNSETTGTPTSQKALGLAPHGSHHGPHRREGR